MPLDASAGYATTNLLLPSSSECSSYQASTFTKKTHGSNQIMQLQHLPGSIAVNVLTRRWEPALLYALLNGDAFGKEEFDSSPITRWSAVHFPQLAAVHVGQSLMKPLCLQPEPYLHQCEYAAEARLCICHHLHRFFCRSINCNDPGCTQAEQL